MVRRAARKDANHNAIADAFEKLGASVHDTSQLGGDFPDMVIGIYSQTILVEIKDGEKIPSQQKLSEGQEKFFRNWKGWTVVVRSLDDVVKTVGLAKQEQSYRLHGFLAANKMNECES